MSQEPSSASAGAFAGVPCPSAACASPANNALRDVVAVSKTPRKKGGIRIQAFTWLLRCTWIGTSLTLLIGLRLLVGGLDNGVSRREFQSLVNNGLGCVLWGVFDFYRSEGETLVNEAVLLQFGVSGWLSELD
jgi:hypothetical protein